MVMLIARLPFTCSRSLRLFHLTCESEASRRLTVPEPQRFLYCEIIYNDSKITSLAKEDHCSSKKI